MQGSRLVSAILLGGMLLVGCVEEPPTTIQDNSDSNPISENGTTLGPNAQRLLPHEGKRLRMNLLMSGNGKRNLVQSSPLEVKYDRSRDRLKLAPPTVAAQECPVPSSTSSGVEWVGACVPSNAMYDPNADTLDVLDAMSTAYTQAIEYAGNEVTLTEIPNHPDTLGAWNFDLGSSDPALDSLASGLVYQRSGHIVGAYVDSDSMFMAMTAIYDGDYVTGFYAQLIVDTGDTLFIEVTEAPLCNPACLADDVSYLNDAHVMAVACWDELFTTGLKSVVAAANIWGLGKAAGAAAAIGKIAQVRRTSTTGALPELLTGRIIQVARPHRTGLAKAFTGILFATSVGSVIEAGRSAWDLVDCINCELSSEQCEG